MNDVIKRIEDYKHRIIKKELEKLELTKQTASKWYSETNMPRFAKQIAKCDKEIKELKQYLTGDKNGSIDVIEKYNQIKDILTIIEVELTEISREEESGYRTKALIKYIEEHKIV